MEALFGSVELSFKTFEIRLKVQLFWTDNFESVNRIDRKG